MFAQQHQNTKPIELVLERQTTFGSRSPNTKPTGLHLLPTNQYCLMCRELTALYVFPMSAVCRKQRDKLCVKPQKRSSLLERSSTQWSFGGIQARTGQKCRVAKATVWELSVCFFFAVWVFCFFSKHNKCN